MGVEEEVQLEEVAGRMVNLSCEAKGHPTPSISWNIVGSQVRLAARVYSIPRAHVKLKPRGPNLALVNILSGPQYIILKGFDLVHQSVKN